MGWTSSPNTRGTIDIIWSCIFVVFLSTWTTLHNNVPALKKGPVGQMQNRATLMFVGFIAPEYLTTIAFTELRTALIVQSYTKNFGY